jgi:hypothetical protein
MQKTLRKTVHRATRVPPADVLSFYSLFGEIRHLIDFQFSTVERTLENNSLFMSLGYCFIFAGPWLRFDFACYE